MNEIKVYIENEPWLMTKAVYVVKRELNKTYLLVNDEWVLQVEGVNVDRKPTLRLSEDIFQMVIDALSKEIKPTEKAEVDAELKSTKYHLEDMRKLVFKGK